MFARYRSVLSVPGCARVLTTALVARLPQGMTSLGLLLLIRSHTGSYTAAGVAVGAYDFATAAGAPLVGRLVDRFGRRRVLGPGAILQTLVLVSLVVAAHAPSSSCRRSSPRHAGVASTRSPTSPASGKRSSTSSARRTGLAARLRIRSS